MTITSIGYPGSVDSIQDAKRSPHIGTLTPVVTGGADSFKAEINSAADRTVNVLPGTASGQGVLVTSDAAIPVQFDSISTGYRWDVIVLRRDWETFASTVMKLTNNALNTEALPNTMQNIPGVQTDQLLWRARITAGQTTPTALVDARARASKIVTVPELLAIPFPELGMFAELPSGVRYRYGLNASNNPAWLRSTGGATKLTGADVWQSEAGWTGSGQTIVAVVGEDSINLSVELRRSGARILSSSSGSITDQRIGTVKAALVPAVKEPFSFVYYGGSDAGSFGSFGGVGELRPDGGLWAMMLSPNAAINTRPAAPASNPGAADYSFRAHVTYAKAGI